MNTDTTTTPRASGKDAHTLFLPVRLAFGTGCFYLRMSNGKYIAKSIGDDAETEAQFVELERKINSHAALVEALAEFVAISGRLDQSATHDGLANCALIAKARSALSLSRSP